MAVRVAGWSRDGEAVEVYLSRGTETEVTVYDGEVESLSSATSAGAGIRVVSGGRQGFAYAGSLDEDVIAETLQEARDNAEFSSPEPWVGLPEPDGSTPVVLDLWRDELGDLPDRPQGKRGARARAGGACRRPPDKAGRDRQLG